MEVAVHRWGGLHIIAVWRSEQANGTKTMAKTKQYLNLKYLIDTSMRLVCVQCGNQTYMLR